MSTTIRKYKMIRMAQGDYLLPSNDANDLWRIYSYLEDGSLERSLGGGRYKVVTGRFWAAAKFNGRFSSDDLSSLPHDLENWEHWDYWSGPWETRKDAIKDVLR